MITRRERQASKSAIRACSGVNMTRRVVASVAHLSLVANYALRHSSVLPITLGLILLCGCDTERQGQKNPFASPNRTDATPILVKIGQNYLAIPANYFDSPVENKYRDGQFAIDDIILLKTIWPNIEGQTSQNSSAFHKLGLDAPRILMLISESPVDNTPSAKRMTFSQQKRFDRTFNIYVEQRGSLTPEGSQYGFFRYKQKTNEHYSVYDGKNIRGIDNYILSKETIPYDVFIRLKPDGSRDAFIRCGGIPYAPGQIPQCTMWVIWPELPDLSVKIDFARGLLSKIESIEPALQNKLIEFYKAGNSIY